ncbi:aldo/keto reductase, partial [Staphylococcus aureus]
VAKEVGRSPAQVSLAWLRQRPTPVIPIVGARKLDQFKDNLASLDLTLNADQLARLNTVSRVPLGFPHEFFDNPMVATLVFA